MEGLCRATPAKPASIRIRRASRKSQNNITSHRKKASLINYVIGIKKKFSRNNINSNTLELSYVVNHCDVRKGVRVTNLNAKEEKVFFENSKFSASDNSDLQIEY